MRLFKKLVDVVRSNINDLLEKAEDPEKMLRLIIADMEEALRKATAATAQAIANERRLKAQYEKYEALAREWEEKALKALQEGREDLARQALTKKVEYQNMAQTYKVSYEEAKATSERLKKELEQLRAKLNEARAKQAALIARSKAAKARKEFSKYMGGFSGEVFSKFDKLEEKILSAEEESKAMLELSESDVEREFEEFQRQKAVDDELAKLKEKLASGS